MTMNKDQFEGRLEEMKGSIKETTGKLVGDKTLEAKGNLQKYVGRIQENVGDLKEDIEDSRK
jgi:uncharacterized protein YjbJ (UPF0337 family)